MADEQLAPQVLFDGDCGMCSAFVRFVLRTSTDRSIVFVALQSTRGQDLLRSHGIDPLVTDSIVFVTKGRAWTYSDAIVEISRSFRVPWNLIKAIAVIPRPLRDLGYRIIARVRRKLLPAPTTCHMLPPDERARIHLG